MLREKRRRLGDQAHAELRAQGLTYEPFVISCYGRLEAGSPNADVLCESEKAATADHPLALLDRGS